MRACEDAGVKHPTIISESGRAVVAYHSVLVFGVLGVSEQGRKRRAAEAGRRSRAAADRHARNVPEPVGAKYSGKLPRRPAGARLGHEPVYQRLFAARSAQHASRISISPFATKSSGWRSIWNSCPRNWKGLDSLLSDTYFCNFSLFQSIPDSWAIKQLFPVHADPSAQATADAKRRARRHHLRFRRQDRPIHRPPRREAHLAAASLRRKALLPRGVSDRRLSGNPRRLAQSLRRHECRARQPGWQWPSDARRR